jgi:hypothetical protein
MYTQWAKENLSPDARMFVNIRDFYKASIP